MTDVIKFDSIRDAVVYAENGNWRESMAVFDTPEYNVTRAASEWRAGPSRDQIARVTKLMEAIDSDVHGQTRDEWTPSPYGAYPVVPDYLAGDPFSMRTKIAVESQLAPITVWVELGLSQSISERDAESRAAAIAAFLAKLGEMRPVEAKIICASTLQGKNKLVQINFDTKTIDASFITQAMAMPQIIRPLRWAMITNGHRSVHQIGFAFQQGRRLATYTREMLLRAAFGADRKDVIIQAAYSDDEETKFIMGKPIKWVHAMIAKQRESNNETD